MIYEFPDANEPIQQGDIFRYIPRIEFDLGNMPVIEGKNISSQDWMNVSKNNDPITFLVAARRVEAIVINQNCDVVRSNDIALCEISTIETVIPYAKDTKSPKSWMAVITKYARENLKWFYLPSDNTIGFDKKMAVDFRSVLHASREYLERNRGKLRIGRLNNIAEEHFRERLSEYFRRYPYDEWYPLNKPEFEEYRKEKGDCEPFPYQV